jgi:CubicO group peptidase (beta-lactamase class C family)
VTRGKVTGRIPFGAVLSSSECRSCAALGEGDSSNPYAGGNVVTSTRTARAEASHLFAELDAKIEARMAAYGIPGVAVGVLYDGREHLKGFGVTNVDHPQAVDPDTVFRVGSTTKVFTGTVVMRYEARVRDRPARYTRNLVLRGGTPPTTVLSAQWATGECRCGLP